jgi:hypothetical protein
MLAVFGRALSVAFIFLGNHNPLYAEHNVSEFVSDRGLIKTNPARLMKFSCIRIRKVSIHDLPENENLALLHYGRNILIQPFSDVPTVEPMCSDHSTWRNDSILHHTSGKIGGFFGEFRNVTYRCAPNVRTENYGRGAALVSRMNRECPRGTHCVLHDGQNPRTFCVNDSLPVQECRLRSFARLGCGQDLPVPAQRASPHARFYDHAGPTR